MQKRLQILNSRIKESQMLKENTMPQPLKMCTTNFLVDAVGDRPVNLMKGHEVLSHIYCNPNLSPWSLVLFAN